MAKGKTSNALPRAHPTITSPPPPTVWGSTPTPGDTVAICTRHAACEGMDAPGHRSRHCRQVGGTDRWRER